MNPLYQQLMCGSAPQRAPKRLQTPQMNPFQRANAVYQAMRNPVAFVQQALPDLPPEIANDPNLILQWLQQTRGITNEQIQQIAGQIPHL